MDQVGITSEYLNIEVTYVEYVYFTWKGISFALKLVMLWKLLQYLCAIVRIRHNFELCEEYILYLYSYSATLNLFHLR